MFHLRRRQRIGLRRRQVGDRRRRQRPVTCVVVRFATVSAFSDVVDKAFNCVVVDALRLRRRQSPSSCVVDRLSNVAVCQPTYLRRRHRSSLASCYRPTHFRRRQIADLRSPQAPRSATSSSRISLRARRPDWYDRSRRRQPRNLRRRKLRYAQRVKRRRRQGVQRRRRQRLRLRRRQPAHLRRQPDLFNAVVVSPVNLRRRKLLPNPKRVERRRRKRVQLRRGDPLRLRRRQRPKLRRR